MTRGRVYTWIEDTTRTLGGRIELAVVPLPRLEASFDGAVGLCGRNVIVHNAAELNEPLEGGGVRAVPVGDPQPDAHGDFLFEPGRGGSRVDRVALAPDHVRRNYIEASHFGAVNAYYHLDRSAAYANALLEDLGAAALPRLTVVVHAHHAATEIAPGERDGVKGLRKVWIPFQGGHYRLPNPRANPREYQPLSPNGEIHLGAGWRVTKHGALPEAAGKSYRMNGSHNAGIMYHEFGHHITRHTADFLLNRSRDPNNQRNLKPDLDEAIADYWAGTMLNTPHIWAWHRRHDAQDVHERSLSSAKTMGDFDRTATADPHANGTIWGSAMWDVRATLQRDREDGARWADRLLIKALLLLGQRVERPRGGASVTRSSFAAGLSALLAADQEIAGGRFRETLLRKFVARGIEPELSLEAAPCC